MPRLKGVVVLRWAVPVLTVVLVSLIYAGAVCAQGIEPWMLSDDIQFRPYGWWIGGYDSSLLVNWGGQERYLRELTEEQKSYLWNKMTPEQRRQMQDQYSAYSGNLKQRPAEWGAQLNKEIADYWRHVNGWDKWQEQMMEKKTPQEVYDFLEAKTNFINQNANTLTPAQIDQINMQANAVESLGQIIATLELKKIEIAVKGISGGLLGIITDYCTGFITHGASAASDAVATAVSKIIDLARSQSGTQLSPAEMIQLLNQQIAVAQQSLGEEVAKQQSGWAQLPTTPTTPATPATPTTPTVPQIPTIPTAGGPVDLSILFLVDCSGSMSGNKIENARQAVINSVGQTNDGKTEWALLGFGGSCTCWQVVPFTTNPAEIQQAAQSLSADGGTPLTYAIYKATTYLAKNGHASRGRLVVLCDGENNCGERQGGGRTEAAAGLRTIITSHNIDGQP